MKGTGHMWGWIVRNIRVLKACVIFYLFCSRKVWKDKVSSEISLLVKTWYCMFLVTHVDQWEDVGLQAWGLNHCVCEEKADVDQRWTGIETIPCCQPSPYTNGTLILHCLGQGRHNILVSMYIHIFNFILIRNQVNVTVGVRWTVTK